MKALCYYMFVPGQVQWDLAVTAFQEKRYFYSAIHALTMVGEQVLFVATLKNLNLVGNTASDIALEVAENATEGICTTIPNDFNPRGLLNQEYNDGNIIKWHEISPDGSKGKALFEWNVDLKYGNHYHITPDSKNRFINPETGDTHLWPGDNIPNEFLDFFK